MDDWEKLIKPEHVAWFSLLMLLLLLASAAQMRGLTINLIFELC